MSPSRIIGGLGRTLSRWSERLVPDPFVFAILLTVVAFVGGVAFFQGEPGTSVGFGARVDAVFTGWWTDFFPLKLMRFAFQMCIVLVTGHALALSRPVQALVSAISRIPKNTAQAAAIVAIVAEVSGILHWGLGAVVGAFLAREIGRAAARQGKSIDYPVLGAAAYMGLLLWHGGLSGSAPLMVAGVDHFLVEQIGSIPTSETLGSMLNLVVTGTMLLLVPLIFWLMAPRDPESFVPFAETGAKPDWDRQLDSDSRPGVVGFLESSRFLALLIGFAGLGWVVVGLIRGTAKLDLDTVNFFFLFAGITLQGSPIRYVHAVADGAKACGGIILQFPFYFGILGVLKASGLVERFAETMADAASRDSLGILVFLSAAIVNLFVPSGGGQWAVQGDVLVQASERVGVGVSETIMAFAYGDQLTNMMQPFWALPLLAITGLKARQIVGYTAAVMFLVTPVFMILLWLFA